MGEFQSAGKTVRYTSEDTLQLASDLYQYLDNEYNGAESIESARLKVIIGHLLSGAPLTSDEWNILSDLERQHGEALEKWRKSGRGGQDARVPQGPGRIAEALVVLPASLRAQLRETAYESQVSSATKTDREITPSHLHDSTLYDLGHALQHAERLPKVRNDKASFDFNHEHMLKHLKSATDHAKRLGEHLEQHASKPKTFLEEKQALKAIREGTPYPPPQLSKAGPTDCWKGQSDPQSGAPRECQSCGMFFLGRCGGYFNLEVEPDWTCKSWFLDEEWSKDDEPMVSVLLESRVSVLPQALRRMREADIEEGSDPHHPGTVCVDFDGVVHMGPHGLPGKVEGAVIPGTEQGLKDLSKHYKVIILTARKDLEAVRVWLKEKDLLKYIEEVTNVKPPASAYIDDRAIHFDNWPVAIQAVDPVTAVTTTTKTKKIA